MWDACVRNVHEGHRTVADPPSRSGLSRPELKASLDCRFLGRLNHCRKQSQIVAWVGATCAGCAPPDSCLGEFHLSAQRLHPSPQRQSAKLWRDTPPDRDRAEAEVPDGRQTQAGWRLLRRPTHRGIPNQPTDISHLPKTGGSRGSTQVSPTCVGVPERGVRPPAANASLLASLPVQFASGLEACAASFVQ